MTDIRQEERLGFLRRTLSHTLRIVNRAKLFQVLCVQFVLVKHSSEMTEYMGDIKSETWKDKTRCANVRADLKRCLLNTDCCKIQKRTPRECLRSHDPSIPEECYALRLTFFECKRSIIDARRRFRGPKGY